MKGPLAGEARAKVGAEALELARGYLKGLDPMRNRRWAIDVRKASEANPFMGKLMRALMGAPSGWSLDIVADAENGDAIAIEAVRELAAEAVARGEAVPERYRQIAARVLAGEAVPSRRGRYPADDRVRNMMLTSAVFRLVHHDKLDEDIALQAVTTAAHERGCNIELPAVRVVYRATPPELIEKESGRFLLSAPNPKM